MTTPPWIRSASEEITQDYIAAKGYCSYFEGFVNSVAELIQKHAPKQEWVKCTDNEGVCHWPPLDTPVLARLGNGLMVEAQVSHDAGIDTPDAKEPAYDYWWDSVHDRVMDDEEVTHWRELPPPPSEGERGEA